MSLLRMFILTTMARNVQFKYWLRLQIFLLRFVVLHSPSKQLSHLNLKLGH